jgi:hypothetical protein
VAVQLWELLSRPAGRCAVAAVDRVGDGHGGREADQQVDMFGLGVVFRWFAAEVRAHLLHDLLHVLWVARPEEPVPVLVTETN